MTALSFHESGFRESVITCEKRGALGEISAFQLLSPLAFGVDANGKRNTAKAICASVPLAASRALAVFVSYAERCKMGGPLALWRAYAKGSCGGPAPVRIFRKGALVVVDKDAGLTRCKTWERLAARAGLVGASCYKRQPIEFKKEDTNGR